VLEHGVTAGAGVTDTAVTVVTLGLFLFIINAMFWSASGFAQRVQRRRFCAALIGSLIYSVFN
jgi:uncharacterized membrane protein YvlD (DUF360 family)